MIRIFKRINIHLLLFWILITSIAPFIFHIWPGHPHKLLFLGLISVVILCLLIRNKLSYSSYPLISIAILLSYYFFSSIYGGDTTLTLQIQCAAYFCMYLYLYNFMKIEDFVRSFILVITLMGIGGTVIFFLHLFIGVNPIFSVDYTPIHTSHFFGLTTSNSYLNIGEIRIIRYSGFFDEPGAYGLYAMYALLLNKLYLDNKKYERLLIILPLFCLSMGFYVFIILYFILFYFQKKYTKYIIPCLIVFSSVLIVISNLDMSISNNKRIYNATIGRFALEDGELQQNSRGGYKENALSIFYEHPFFGDGKSAGASVYYMLAQHGVIGSIWSNINWVIYFLIIIQYSRGKQKFMHLKVLFLILISYYHRPGLDPLTVILSFCFMHSILDYRTKQLYKPKVLSRLHNENL